MSQNTQILEYLKTGKSLTPLEALDIFGCLRLASRINDLKKEPYNANIGSETIVNLDNGKRYSSYFLVKNKIF